MVETANIVHTFTAREGRGTGPTPALVSDLTTFYDGPRAAAVGDTTRFWLDRFGGPWQIRNALGETTTLTRSDPVFPGLVTEVVHANGFVERATYNARGNVETHTQVAPYGVAGEDAVTRYAYTDVLWPDFPTRITQPANELVDITYSPLNGNRLTQQDADGASSRVEFRYYDNGAHAGLLRAVDPPGSLPDSVTYDVSGNLSGTGTPKGYWTYAYADAIGRDTLISSPVDTANTVRQKQRLVYDALSRDTLTESVSPLYHSRGPDTLRVRKRYDAESNLLSLHKAAFPDRNSIGWSNTAWRYDRAGRKLRETAPDSLFDSWTYDEAGNVTSWQPRQGEATTLTYDALNRLGVRTNSDDEARFTYNSAGLMKSATNRYARVTRAYYPNGALAHDTLRIQPVTLVAVDSLWSGYHTHEYGLDAYDLNGRRTLLVHPSSIAPSGPGLRGYVQYGYDPVHGRLAWVEGLGTNSRFDFDYNEDRQLETTYFPGNITETLRYDDDGRLLTRHTASPAAGWFGGGYLRADTMRYDARDKLTNPTATFAGSGGISHGFRSTNTYDAAGHLIETQHIDSPHQGEQWTADALGNHTVRSYSDQGAPLRNQNYAYTAATGRLMSIIQPDTVLSADTLKYLYDNAGNQTFSGEYRKFVPNPRFPFIGGQFNQYRVERTTYFDALQKVIETHRLSSQQEGAGLHRSEYYRYDALGRRVWRHAINGWAGSWTARDSVCTRPAPSSDCKSFVERTVWDGDQVLYEIRARSDSSQNGAMLEDDQTPFDPHYGRVAYTHAGGIDQPLEIVRLDDNEAPVVAVPHANWRGNYDIVTFTGGEYASSGPAIGWPTATERYPIDLVSVSSFGISLSTNFDGTEGGPRSWFGNLITGQQDGSGLLYRRNRYVDPKQGRFTQEDPIGLAGGLNLYGFANGDPVNFSDPFGLCPPGDNNNGPHCNRVWFAGIGLDLFVGKGVGGAVGISYSKGEGLGLYARGSIGAGIAVNASAEFGSSRNRDSFEGKALEGCAGGGGVAIGGGACVASSKAGLTVSGNVGVGTKDLPLPITTRAGGSYTRSVTTRDITEAFKEFLRQAQQASLKAAGVPAYAR